MVSEHTQALDLGALIQCGTEGEREGGGITHTRIQGECRPPKGLAQLQDACMLTRVGGAIRGHRSLSVEALDQRALIKKAVVRAVARAVARAASHLRFIRPKIHKIPSILLKDPLFGIPCRCEE